MKNISFRNDVLPLKNQLFRLALRITLNKAEAEDIVQDTMIKVWNNRDKWSEIDSIEAYCFTITRHLSLDRVKKRDNQTDSLDNLPIERPDTTSNPYEKTSQQDHIQLLHRLVDSLPEKQKSCMQLRDFEGKSYKEIAAILELTEEQVKINIFRARQAVKKQYQTYDQYGL